MSTKVQAIQCNKCKDTIYSVAQHDFHYCSCGDTSVDGGFEYMHVGFPPGTEMPKQIEVKVLATKKELYDDWNSITLIPRKYGTIKYQTNIDYTPQSELGDIEDEGMDQ